MSFVASPEQVAAFQRRCAEPAYSQEGISTEFITTKEFIESVLPPTLESADVYTGLINVSLWQSNVCGSFELSSVSVRCRHGDIDGYWVLHLIVTEVSAITWGRETWGEIKKDGKVRLMSNGTRKFGYAERGGVRLIEMEADFTEEDKPATSVEWFDFEAKVYPNAQGNGLDADPQLITLKVVDKSGRHATGKGSLKLQGTSNNPLHLIPITSVGDFEYCTGTSTWTVYSTERLCSAKEYMPYLVLRHYDNLVDLPVGPGLPSLIDKTKPENETIIAAQTWMSRD